MAKTNKARAIRFKDAIDSCKDIKGKMQKGLSAMGSNSKAVKVSDTNLIDGSLDIDNAVKALYPNEARWDYAIGYANDAYFVEVHPADTKNVMEMVEFEPLYTLRPSGAAFGVRSGFVEGEILYFH